MTTQKFMGRNQLVDRLAAQVGSKDMAIGILKKRGQMKDDGTLTAAGQARNRMTAEERAKDRAVKSTGHPAKDFTYSARTNRATLKGR
jgi:hypothetical protein